MTTVANGGDLVAVVDAGDGRMVVSAKAVHAALEVGRDFSTWLRDRIKRYGFEEGLDYWPAEDALGLDSPERGKAGKRFPPVPGKTSVAEKNLGGRPEQDYWLTLDMAKELAMLERSDAGRRARKYFLECERRLRVAQEELVRLGLEMQRIGQSKPEEYRLSEEERRLFNWYRWVEHHRYELVNAMTNDIDAIVLPYVLREVLWDAGVDEEKIDAMNLLGYEALMLNGKVTVQCEIRESDVAHRLRTNKISPRLVRAVEGELANLFDGRRMGKREEVMRQVLKGFGLR